MEFANEQAVAEAGRRVAGELVQEVISRRFPSEEALVARARALRLNLRRPLRVFLLGIGSPPSVAAVPADGLADYGETRLLTLVGAALFRFPGATVVATRSGSVVGLAQFRERDEVALLSGLLKGAVGEARPALEAELAAGVGRSCGLAEAAESYHDAVTALRIGRLLGQTAVTVIDDLGPCAFLAEVRSSPALRDFYQRTVGRVVDHDVETGGTLARTLQAYCESGGSVQAAARALYVHTSCTACVGPSLSPACASGRLGTDELALRVGPLVDPRFCTLVTVKRNGNA